MTEFRSRAARDPLKRGMQAGIIELFAPLGAPMRFETNSRELLEACRTSFGRYGAAKYRAEAELMTARFFVDPDFAEEPPWPDPVFRSHGPIFYISVGRQNLAVADLERRSVTAFLSPAMAQDSFVLRRIFLDCAVLTLLTHGPQGRYSYVHASAVARGTKGLLFSGPSEAGKSSLAYACARSGFDFVSDDVVYLRREGSDLAAWGRPWRLRLLQSGLNLFPELSNRGDAAVPVDGGVLEFELADILPGRSRIRCAPAAVLFLERSEGSPFWEILDESEAVDLLSRDLLYDDPEALERHLRVWQDLARKGAFRLRCGSDIEALVAALFTFVNRLPGESMAT